MEKLYLFAGRADDELDPDLLSAIELADCEITTETVNILYDAFYGYLSHGSFLTAINDLEEKGYIPGSTFYTYSDWIRGDLLKRENKNTIFEKCLKPLFCETEARSPGMRLHRIFP